MKKTLCMAVAMLSLTSLCFGQSAQFQKGQKDIQLGFSFLQGTQLDLYAGSTLSEVKFNFPQPFLSVDYGITDEISIGGYFSSAKGDYAHFQGNYELFKLTTIGARGLYHFDIHELFDVYGGVGLGVQSQKGTAVGYFFDDPPVTYTKSTLTYLALGGGRYRFTEKLGAFLELSYGSTSIVNLGINLKL